MKVKRPIIVGDHVAIVPLTRGKTAIVDSRDIRLVEGRNWYAQRCRAIWYARSDTQSPRRTIAYMRRLILQPPDGTETDHANHDGLDNRRSNLRVCTRGENMANSRRLAMASSQFRGVSWDKQNLKWQVCIQEDGKRVNLGRFKHEVEAAQAYDEAALKMYGEFASLNFTERIER